MPSLADVLQGAQQQPQMSQAASAPSATTLASIAQQPQQQMPIPAPSHAETMAAMHRFGEIKQALLPVIDDKNLGKTNIRPKLLDAASKLLGSKVLSLTEVMNSIRGLPDDPLQQKKFVENIYNTATQAQTAVLAHHRNAPPEPEDAEPWSMDNHEDNMTNFMNRYGNKDGGR